MSVLFYIGVALYLWSLVLALCCYPTYPKLVDTVIDYQTRRAFHRARVRQLEREIAWWLGAGTVCALGGLL